MKFYLFILATFLFACNNQATTNKLPKGTPIHASGYSRIICNIGADVHIQMNADSPYYCYLQCEKSIEPLITFDIVNDELHIGAKDNAGLNSAEPIVISMRVQDLKSVTSNGSGTMEISGDVKSDNFDVGHHGSGTVHIKSIQNQQVCIQCKGSGDVHIQGTTKNLITQIHGSGNIKAFGLQAEATEAAISGSGNMETSVAQTLDADIMGSGNIFYKGKPSIRNSITGSGLVTAK